MKTRRRALVLQGGGSLGAYAYGAIKALYEQPNFSLDVVTGVSIGAINAAVLVGAKEDPIKALDKLWREYLTIRQQPFTPSSVARYSSLLTNPAMYSLRPSYVYNPLMAPFLETSVYDTTPLRRTLSDLVDFDRLNRSETRLVVSAVDIETGETVYFENNAKEPLSVEHIVASGSLAPGFPMTSIKDPLTGKEKLYWDGGFASNLPLSKAIELLEQTDSGNPDVERELIVIELIPMQSRVPTNLIEVDDRVTQLMFSSKLTLDEKLFEKMNNYVELVEQVDQALPADSPIRQLPGYREIRRHKKIDSFLIITMSQPLLRTGASDFSQTTVERRIAAGYDDTLAQLEKAAT